MGLMSLLAVKRFLPHIIGGAVIIFALYAIHNAIYSSGYDDAVAEYQGEVAKATRQALEEANKQFEIEMDRVAVEQTQALERAKSEARVQTKVKTVTEYVDRIVVKTECTDLADDVVGMLSQSTGIVLGASGKGGESTDTGRPENILPAPDTNRH